jgi:hypothetical protein
VCFYVGLSFEIPYSFFGHFLVLWLHLFCACVILCGVGSVAVTGDFKDSSDGIPSIKEVARADNFESTEDLLYPDPQVNGLLDFSLLFRGKVKTWKTKNRTKKNQVLVCSDISINLT